MLPALDLRTMVLIYVGIRVGLALVLVYLWSVQRNYPPVKDCAVGALVSAAGLFLFALRDLAPAWVSEILSNALVLPGWMIFDYGIAKAAGRRPPLKLGLTLCALAVASMAWHTLVAPNHAARVLTQNLVFIVFDLYAAYACFKVSDASRIATFRLIGTLLALLATACLWRVANGVFDVALALSQTPSRVLLVAASLIAFPMITMLFALQTSQGLQEEINVQARHDMLTGAFNRRAFDELVNSEWSRSVRHDYPFSVLTVDIDHFKKFNDQHGHLTGDATLVRMSHAAQASLRSNDIWCRYGGEEFVALLPNTTIEQAVTVAERLRASVEMATIAAPDRLLKVSVSIGVAQRSAAQSHWTEVLAASDAALYQAKAAGRNRVVAANLPISL
jgi:diguanylate cyclase (GGDEF)-like protein